MDIKTLLSIRPRKIPPTPQAVTQYLMMDDKARHEFNSKNPNAWFPFDNPSSNPPGFFSDLREALGFNSEWIRIIKEEIKNPEHENNTGELNRLLRAFYHECYVGPMIGALPFFNQWALPWKDDDLAPAATGKVNWSE